MSNTKLSNEQKIDLKRLRETQKNVLIQHFRVSSLTLCVTFPFAHSNTVFVAVSASSPKELKFRNKVGEFHARCRLKYGQYIALPVSSYHDWITLLEDIDHVVGDINQ